MAAWCSKNNLALNTKKTQELIINFRKHSTELACLYINVKCVERVHTFRFLAVLIFADMSWTDNGHQEGSAAAKQQRVLRKHSLDSNLLLTFYH